MPFFYQYPADGQIRLPHFLKAKRKISYGKDKSMQMNEF
jgi:hypothetical protein